MENKEQLEAKIEECMINGANKAIPSKGGIFPAGYVCPYIKNEEVKDRLCPYAKQSEYGLYSACSYEKEEPDTGDLIVW